MTLQNADESMPDLSMVNRTLWVTYRDKAGLTEHKNTLQNPLSPEKEKGITPVMRNHLTYSSYNTSYKLIVIANLSKGCQKDC